MWLNGDKSLKKDAVLTLKSYFIEQNLVWKIKNVPDKSISNTFSIDEICRIKNAVVQIATNFTFHGMNDFLHQAFLYFVTHNKQINATFPILNKNTGNNENF